MNADKKEKIRETTLDYLKYLSKRDAPRKFLMSGLEKAI